MSEKETIGRSPNYYIKKRLQNNKPAMFGLYLILFTTLVAILGYLIMPDDTPDANDGAVQIQKKLPGFEVVFLQMRKDFDVPSKNIFHKAISGQESSYIKIPVSDFWISKDTVFYNEFGRKNQKKHIMLVPSVFPLYIGEEKLLDNGKNYRIKDNTVEYVNNESKVNTTSLKQVQEKFEKKIL